MKINIAMDFSDIPIGRARSDGDVNGEAFREDWLRPNLEKASKGTPLVVNLNGAEGYPYHFLEEAFGGLVRKGYFTARKLEQILKIEATHGYIVYRDIIWECINEAAAHSSNNSFDQAGNMS